MNVTAIIPARMASQRLPAKPLVKIAGKTLIQRVYEAVTNTELFDQVIIATDHQQIYEHAESFGAIVLMTSDRHQTGTDRIAECINKLNIGGIIVNVQGDEPFITKAPLENLINVFKDKKIECASLMHVMDDHQEINNPNNVKVVIDKRSYAIYFSRSTIPFPRDNEPVTFYKHIGVYAYRVDMLYSFVSMPQGVLEKAEKLEQLRLLENGFNIRMVLTDYKGIGIDTEEDLIKAKALFDDN